MIHVTGSEANDPYLRARKDAERALRLSENSREFARLTRLRLKLESLAASLRARPGKANRAELARFDEILEAVMEVTDATMGNIQLVDRESGALRILTHRGFDRPFLDFFDAVHEGEAACGQAFERAAPVVIEDVSADPLFAGPARKIMRDARVAAVQSVALVTASKRRVGVVSVHYRDCGISVPRQKALALLAPQIAELVALGVRV